MPVGGHRESGGHRLRVGPGPKLDPHVDAPGRGDRDEEEGGVRRGASSGAGGPRPGPGAGHADGSRNGRRTPCRGPRGVRVQPHRERVAGVLGLARGERDGHAPDRLVNDEGRPHGADNPGDHREDLGEVLVRVARSRQDVQRATQQGPLLVHRLVLAAPERIAAVAVDGGWLNAWPVRAPKVRDRWIGADHPDKGAPTHRDRPSPRRTRGDVRRYQVELPVASYRVHPAGSSARGAVSPGARSAPVARSRDGPRRAPHPRTLAPHLVRQRSGCSPGRGPPAPGG